MEIKKYTGAAQRLQTASEAGASPTNSPFAVPVMEVLQKRRGDGTGEADHYLVPAERGHCTTKPTCSQPSFSVPKLFLRYTNFERLTTNC